MAFDKIISIMNIQILILSTSVISVILALHPNSGYGKIVGGVEAPRRKIIKSRYSGTDTIIKKSLPLCFDITEYIFSKKMGYFFQILWPSQNI